MTDPLTVVTDEETNQFHKLYAPRLEAWFLPNEDGSPSIAGKIRFYCQWWFFRNGARYATEPGPQIEHEFSGMLGRTWDLPDGSTLTTTQILMAIETVLRVTATEQLAVVDAQDEPQPPPVDAD